MASRQQSSRWCRGMSAAVFVAVGLLMLQYLALIAAVLGLIALLNFWTFGTQQRLRLAVPFQPVPGGVRLSTGGLLMDEKTKEKLFLWSQLCRQCEQLELDLRSAKSSGSDCDAIEAELKDLKERAAAMFKKAAQALRSADSGSGSAGTPS
jgi:hypothetical protein